MQTEFVVTSATAKMPASCKGRYRRVAVLEVVKGTVPAMISERAKGVVRIVEVWERLNVGTTDRSAYAQAVNAATRLAEHLTAQAGQSVCA